MEQVQMTVWRMCHVSPEEQQVWGQRRGYTWHVTCGVMFQLRMKQFIRNTLSEFIWYKLNCQAWVQTGSDNIKINMCSISGEEWKLRLLQFYQAWYWIWDDYLELDSEDVHILIFIAADSRLVYRWTKSENEFYQLFSCKNLNAARTKHNFYL